MTMPFDPLNPPNAAIGVRAGMFGDSFHCPNQYCGFASSDPNIFECPSCQTVWRKRPEKQVVQAGPSVGTPMALVCALCGNGFTASDVPVFDGSGLAHSSCLAGTGKPYVEQPESVPEGYLRVLQETQEKPKPKRKRRRKRKRPANVQASFDATVAKREAVKAVVGQDMINEYERLTTPAERAAGTDDATSA